MVMMVEEMTYLIHIVLQCCEIDTRCKTVKNTKHSSLISAGTADLAERT